MTARFWRLCAYALAAIAAAVSPSALWAMDLVEVVAKVGNAVVRVDTDRGHGSGVIIAEGLVVTNFHVVEGVRRAKVVFRTGQTIETSGYLAIDPKHDLALIKTSRLADIKPIPLNVELPKVGEKVATFGCPEGFSFTTSEGIVSAIRSGQELIGIVGPDAKLAPDSTWIQTTASISHGNSGGPLVNMNAEIVGLNTRSYPGQNLNLAIGSQDIKRLIDNAATIKVPTAWEQMPQQRAVPVAPVDPRPRKKGKMPDFKLALPTGRVFSFETFNVDPNQLKALVKSAKGDFVILNYPSGKPFAVARQEDGLLSGPTIAQWENEASMVYGMYANGKRHGLLLTWDEASQPVLFAQYVNGKRHGFSCFFVDGEFRLLCEYKNDQVQYAQLMSHFSPDEGFRSRAEAEKNTEARELLEKQDEIEAKLKASEITFRKSVAEAEKAQRRALAAQLGPEKRARASQRRQEAEAQNNAVHDAMWRRFWNK